MVWSLGCLDGIGGWDVGLNWLLGCLDLDV